MPIVCASSGDKQIEQFPFSSKTMWFSIIKLKSDCILFLTYRVSLKSTSFLERNRMLLVDFATSEESCSVNCSDIHDTTKPKEV